MILVQYEAKDIRTVSLSLDDWKRLIEISDVSASAQDQRILDALRYATLNGKAQP